jgi:hypothetical protein
MPNSQHYLPPFAWDYSCTRYRKVLVLNNTVTKFRDKTSKSCGDTCDANPARAGERKIAALRS